LIKGLLRSQPSERLPIKPGGIRNIQTSRWYKNFDWAAMENLTLEPPYKPQVKGKTDIANFTASKEHIPKALAYEDDGSGWDKDFEM